MDACLHLLGFFGCFGAVYVSLVLPPESIALLAPNMDARPLEHTKVGINYNRPQLEVGQLVVTNPPPPHLPVGKNWSSSLSGNENMPDILSSSLLV